MKLRRWTDTDVTALEMLVANGLDAKSIAKRLHRTESAVRAAIIRRAPDSKSRRVRRVDRLTNSRLEKARRYYRVGMNARSASVKADLGPDVLRKQLTDEDRRLHNETLSKPRCTKCGVDLSDFGVIRPTLKVRRGRRIWQYEMCGVVYRFPVTSERSVRIRRRHPI